MTINIVRPYMPDLSEIAEEFAQCLKSGLMTNNSPHVRRFEDELQDYYGCAIKPSVNCNGEMALYHLIQAWKQKLGYGPHDSFEVLVPSFTFSGTINAVATNNLRPLSCDVDETWSWTFKEPTTTVLNASNRDHFHHYVELVL
jgi:dTDP-4-amino-4,6-dideoxygalactose transaminase